MADCARADFYKKFENVTPVFPFQPPAGLVSDNRHRLAQFATPVGRATPVDGIEASCMSSGRHTTYRSSSASVKDLASVKGLTLESAWRQLSDAWPTPAGIGYAV